MPSTMRNGLSLGRTVWDANATPEEQSHRMAQFFAGMGYPCPAKTGDDPYESVFVKVVAGDDVLVAGNPSDPTNPRVLTLVASGGATMIIERNNVQILATADTLNFSTSFTVADAGGGQADIGIDVSAAASLAFKTIAVSGQSSVVADSTTDTLTLVAGTNVTITTDAATDTITIAAASGATETFKTIVVAGQSDIVADSTTDTLTVVAGLGIVLTTNAGSDTLTIKTAVNAASWVVFVGNEIAVDWDGMPGYSGGEDQLLGHKASSADLPEWDSVGDWLKTLPGYSSTALLGVDGDIVQWKTIEDWLKLLLHYGGNAQSIGHDAGSDPEWQDDTTACP